MRIHSTSALAFSIGIEFDAQLIRPSNVEHSRFFLLLFCKKYFGNAVYRRCQLQIAMNIDDDLRFRIFEYIMTFPLMHTDFHHMPHLQVLQYSKKLSVLLFTNLKYPNRHFRKCSDRHDSFHRMNSFSIECISNELKQNSKFLQHSNKICSKHSYLYFD